MSQQYTAADLEAYLDEALSPAEMSEIEGALRESPELLQMLAQINGRRDAGVHSLGEIWRRHRISCPTREQLGSFLLGALDDETLDYITFHLEEVGCRFCAANVRDLKERQAENVETKATRRKKYFDSSVGYLRSE